MKTEFLSDSSLIFLILEHFCKSDFLIIYFKKIKNKLSFSLVKLHKLSFSLVKLHLYMLIYLVKLSYIK